MSAIHQAVIASFGGSSNYTPVITKSARCRSTVPNFLTRAIAVAGNRKTFTMWVYFKRGIINGAATAYWLMNGSSTQFGGVCITGAGWGTAADRLAVAFNGFVNLETNELLRDPNAFEFVMVAVDTTQAVAADRIKLYRGFRQITSFAVTSYPALNADLNWNAVDTIQIGRQIAGVNPFDGEIAYCGAVEGLQLTPAAVMQYWAPGNVYLPKAYTGAWGTNGFLLEFLNSANFGLDTSGNGNNFTSSGFSNVAGVTFDQFNDVPTTNYAVLNCLVPTGGTYENANCQFNGVAGAVATVTSSIGMQSGKYYAEFIFSNLASEGIVGIAKENYAPTNFIGNTGNTLAWGIRSFNGNKYYNGVGTATSIASWTTGDVMSVAIDATAGNMWVGKNGTWVDSGNPGTGANPTYSGLGAGTFFFAAGDFTNPNSSVFSFNSGQQPFVHSVPAGFSACNTANLPTPAIPVPQDYYDAQLRTGNGAITNVTGYRFQPSMVRSKSRTTATDHLVFDSVRGPNNYIITNGNAVQAANANTLTAFLSNGFTLGTDAGAIGINISAASYIDRCFKAGTLPGIQIIPYVGDGVSGRTLAHTLGVAPEYIEIKRLDGAVSDWICYHKYMAASPATGYLSLNTTGAFTVAANIWNNVAPSSTQITLGNSAAVNAAGANYIAYVFVGVPGFSKFGKIIGNGSADGSTFYTGFLPSFIQYKALSGANNWFQFDRARDPVNPAIRRLCANLNVAEDTSSLIDLVSTGSKARQNNVNFNGGATDYVVAAFAAVPLKYTFAG